MKRIKQASDVSSMNLIYEHYQMPPMSMPQTHPVLVQKTIKSLPSKEVAQIINAMLHAVHVANSSISRELATGNPKAARRYQKLKRKAIAYLGQWAMKAKELELES